MTDAEIDAIPRYNTCHDRIFREDDGYLVYSFDHLQAVESLRRERDRLRNALNQVAIHACEGGPDMIKDAAAVAIAQVTIALYRMETAVAEADRICHKDSALAKLGETLESETGESFNQMLKTLQMVTVMATRRAQTLETYTMVATASAKGVKP